MPIYDFIEHELSQLRHAGLMRRRRSNALPCDVHSTLNGKRYTNFCSNDYLGLASHPQLIAAAQGGATQWGVGSGASHLISGHYEIEDQLEKRLAEMVGCEAALCFSTGYLANLAVMPTLLGRHDAIFADRLNHASLVDGAHLARAELIRYPHSDVDTLRSQLQASTAKHKLIVSDTLFSMDGDLAPIPELLALAEEFDTWLLLDDAHGFGILGPQGRGALAAFQKYGLANNPRVIYMATLGKAAGVAGAFVAATQSLITLLINRARSYIYTTAAPPLLTYTCLEALDLLEQSDERRQHLNNLIAQIRTDLRCTHWQLIPSDSPIQALVIGDNQKTLEVAQALYEQGIWVPAIRPPTVPIGRARLRISLSASHTHEQLARLIEQLNNLQS